MEAKEIRIGNWYEHNGEHKKVTPSVIEEVWNAERQWCKPIPLTPEILKKAGFTVDCVHIHDYKGYGFKTTQIDYIVGGWADDFRSFEITSTESDKGIVYNHKCRANIKHLHQLQNLYFALTGEELKIEL